VCYESPPGIKKNFARIYQQLEASGTPLRATFIFLLAFFHALVQERRTYIPQGWSKIYEFSYSDLKVAMEVIDNLIKEYEQTNSLNLDVLYGIFEEGIYGGRIDNPSDLKVLRAYLNRYFNLMVINGQAEVAQGLTIPKNQKELTAFISKQPDIDNPSLFGLPPNIDKVVQRNNSMATISNLKKLTAIVSEHGQLKREDWLRMVSPIAKSWEQIYKQIK
jgi:dynein heavy chain 2